MQATIPALYAAAGEDNVMLSNAITGAEDFSFFAQEVPGVFLFLGGKSLDLPAAEAPPHHTPDFYIDESGMPLGVRALCYKTMNYLASQ
jgi:amidohydrolase